MGEPSSVCPYVLVAEDDDAMRDVLVAALRCLCPNVVAVEDGHALFMRLLEAQHSGRSPELVISDIFMPRMTGLEVLAAVRCHGIVVDFVFLTGFGNDDAINEAKAAGALRVFEKPFDLDALSTLVQHPERQLRQETDAQVRRR